MEKQLDEVRAKMESSSQRLSQLEKELNVVNPEEKTSIQTARLLQLNTAYTAAQGDRVQKQAAYDATKTGQLEALQVSGQGESLRKLHERLNEASEKFAQMKTHFGSNHPEYRRAAAQQREVERQFDEMRQNIRQRVEVEYRESLDREKRLEAEVAQAKVEMDRINARSGEYQKVKREAETDKTLYEELVRKIRESNINAGFQNNTVRVADRGRPGWKPVFPKIPLNAALAFVFSLLVAVGAAILSDTLDSTVRDPEQAARMLNTHVIGTLPAVRDIKQLTIPVMLGTGPNGAMQMYKGRSQDRQISTYEEAVRTLRSSVLLTDFDRRIRTLLFTSATAGEGKSTTASHLAFVHAEQKKRTLLVDCDLRRPSQHKIFGVPSNLGLSNVLNGEIGWRQALIRLETNPNLDILTAGPPSRRAADLVGPMIQGLVEEMSKDYDLIVLDGPPLLGFAESLQMASSADGVIVVTRAGETSRKAVGAAMNTLARLRANAVGLVLNQVKKHHSDHYYYYGYYGKYYKRYQTDQEDATKTVEA